MGNSEVEQRLAGLGKEVRGERKLRQERADEGKGREANEGRVREGRSGGTRKGG